MARGTADGLARPVVAEALGTAALLAAIVGSGIVVSQDGPASAQLFHHAVAVGLALGVLIVAFGPVSGAHFNPAVTLVDAWFGGTPWRRAAAYVGAQLVGAVMGTVFTTATFGAAAVSLAATARTGFGIVAAEGAATAGLVVVVFGLVRSGRGRAVPAAVGAYIGTAVYVTASAAFANPAVTLARMLTDTWTGIRPADVPGFLVGQSAGAAAAALLVGWLFAPQSAADADVPGPDRARSSHAPVPSARTPEGS